MALAPTTPRRVQAYERNRAGVPQASGRPFVQKLLHPWFAVVCAVLALEVWAVAYIWREMTTTVEQEDGTVVPGYKPDVLVMAAKAALPTLLVLVALFIIADRYRPQRLWGWLLSLSWGGTVACGLALFLNTWASEQLAVAWWAPGYDQVRVAAFIAPFVEETAKAVILFVIAFVARGRITSKVSGIVLAGLTAAGFAFTENIIYYARAIVSAQYNYGAGAVEWVLGQYVLQRGIYTAWAHPLFTIMTGIGVAVACRTRSKLVRVLAPTAGFLAAALGHMSFNSAVSLLSEDTTTYMYLLVALPLVSLVMIVTRITLARQRALIANRLTDYVVMGWLPATYPALFSRWWTRTKAVMISPWHGSPVATVRLQNAVTELAYLRDAVARGIADDGALWREHELIFTIRRLRSQRAIENPRGLRPYFRRRRQQKLGWARPQGLPAGVPASRQLGPAAQPAAQGGTLRYSAVDPRWGPPA
jgi:RsiW-degrading membrane proteinase PrsW (M82 family)